MNLMICGIREPIDKAMNLLFHQGRYIFAVWIIQAQQRFQAACAGPDPTALLCSRIWAFTGWSESHVSRLSLIHVWNFVNTVLIWRFSEPIYNAVILFLIIRNVTTICHVLEKKMWPFFTQRLNVQSCYEWLIGCFRGVQLVKTCSLFRCDVFAWTQNLIKNTLWKGMQMTGHCPKEA